MSLSDFIVQNLNAILDEWALFAASIVPARHTVDRDQLLDHAKRMLEVIAADLRMPETPLEQAEKSKGHAPLPAFPHENTAATMHGMARLVSGFSLDATVSEYRALRASVTRLWEQLPQNQPMAQAGVIDLIRFNEAIDQALAESVASYYFAKEHETRVFDAILASTPDLVFTFAPDGKLTYANRAFLERLGMDRDAVIGKRFEDLGLPHAADIGRHLRLVVDTRAQVRGEMRIASAQGPEDQYEYILVPVLDENDQAAAVAATSRNITDRKSAEIRHWKLANFDPLTGLPNRSLFRDRLEHEVRHAARTGAPMALLFVDLDQFKEANDRFGHDTGDLLLQYAAARMRTCVRDTDTVARLGGDEFTIILQELSESGHAEEVARKVLAQMAQPFHIKQLEIHISASIGIALAPLDAATPDELLKEADQAMYASKEAGRNRFSFYASLPRPGFSPPT